MAKKQQDQCWMGVDLGGTKILSAVYNQEFQYLGSKRLRTQSERGCEVVIERLIRTIQETLEKTEVSVDRLAGIGIGGALGLISSTLMLFVLVDASVNGAEEPVWLMLCAIVGVFIGAVIYKIVLWSSKGSSYLQ